MAEAQHISSGSVVLASRLPLQRRRRRATLQDLAELIRQAHAPTVEFAKGAHFAASVTIQCAVACGGYLREAKAARDPSGKPLLKHGEFLPWVKRECGVEPRTASNYMRLHIWVCGHQTEILKAKPHSLRQFYILAGILPEDESKPLPREQDDMAKLRRAVRNVMAEAAAHREYAEAAQLWRVLEPLAKLLREVSTDTRNGKHISGSDGWNAKACPG